MNDILDYFGKIDEITADVEPTYHVLELHNVFRDDVTFSSLEQDAALANAPRTKEGFFKAPRIM